MARAWPEQSFTILPERESCRPGAVGGFVARMKRSGIRGGRRGNHRIPEAGLTPHVRATLLNGLRRDGNDYDVAENKKLRRVPCVFQSPLRACV